VLAWQESAPGLAVWRVLQPVPVLEQRLPARPVQAPGLEASQQQ
jgi:hypothetical protein